MASNLSSLTSGSTGGYALAIEQAKARGQMPKSMPVNKKAWETAESFEASFFQSMLGSMFETVEGEGPLGGSGTGQDAWRGMLIEQYGKTLTAKGGIGLAPQIYREMLRSQESSSHAVSRP
jgi:peptidoglycan hydrolase FlgJ